MAGWVTPSGLKIIDVWPSGVLLSRLALLSPVVGGASPEFAVNEGRDGLGRWRQVYRWNLVVGSDRKMERGS